MRGGAYVIQDGKRGTTAEDRTSEAAGASMSEAAEPGGFPMVWQGSL
ncbi:hypothetical protein PR001_g18997 [Phytophthora rubi]|uniref:Uncharacterized protein n=1 Tax=Phytophthora rubi TaxID=129364 RepID=A0A6A3JWE0_9STRA|nr:hypothetical protein PR001_g18997 [Phytophthora rubi]